MTQRTDDDRPDTIAGEHRPHPNLLKYWTLQSLVLGPFFPLLLVPRFFKYRTLVYRFDEEGVSASWGVLFRRETSLNYSRIQDIHLASNVVERWLGLARIQVQTASGAAGAEMTIEGLPEFETVRDWLYSRMRGTREGHTKSRIGAPAVPGADVAPPDLASALHEVARELRRVRQLLERASPGDGTGPGLREPGP